ncbi:MAG: cystathionine beta-synthase [Candidatus Scalindua rubra]|uniref:Cysteine synthase n=1 Tax=Candidatus Scalindua rubra TaxID=1872076 RepID=A0A1E3XAU2_9BACT|nr:MAG: cystathionine beta-synthase [Candidatus Scalindua rubra]
MKFRTLIQKFGKVTPNILKTIGWTPIVKLNKIGRYLNSNIFVKLEFFNPAGSVKDRMALFIIEDAERRGLLKPGGTIVENSSGNTGAALAMIAATKGYKCIITMPDKMSDEKKNLMKAFGAKVVVTPTDVPPDSPESYYSVAKRIVKETPNSYYPDQYNNPRNIDSHYYTTGPEIWKQTGGDVDYFVAGIGTGGTLSGAGRYLKERNPEINIIAVDPEGSVFYDYFKTGKLIKPHVYKVEGIGEDYVVKAVDFELIDDIIKVHDKESFLMARRLAKEEGIFAGGSSGSAVWAAVKIARRIKESKNIVVILPDSGSRYLSKVYNDEWMRVNGFLE